VTIENFGRKHRGAASTGLVPYKDAERNRQSPMLAKLTKASVADAHRP
jgi:hypothetical protein